MGHLDHKWDHASLVAQSHDLALEFPLGIGALIENDTTSAVDLQQLAAQVRIALGY